MITTLEGTAPATTGATTAHPGDSGDIKAIEAFTRSLEETVHIDTVLGMYDQHALRISPFTPGLQHGVNEIRTDLKKRLSDLVSRRVTHRDINVVTNGNMATAHGQQTIASAKMDGTVDTTTQRFHDVLVKRGGSWVVLVQHASYAADFSTMGAWQGGFIKPGELHWDEDPFPTPAIDVEQAKYELNLWQIDDVRAQTADQAMHFYGPGDYATVYDSRYPEGRMVGMWDIYQGWLPQMQLKHVEETLKEFRVWTDGQFAAHFTLGNVVSDKLGAPEFHAQIRQVDCLHKVDGQWYSYVESVSFPIDEATGKVVVDLPAQQQLPAKKG